ncbi:MAG: glycosyltransferase family 2 protein [Cyanobacteriota bacterium]|nr:glycosyltransferase family 2 protein [Cyanobacteriota bacterium]
MTSHPVPPVLLLAWRRPDCTRQVIDALRAVRPGRLYVACDGPAPQRPGEAALVKATRDQITAAVDWPCQVNRLFSETNQGCQLGVSRAISWFFAQEEEGVVLEDDCVPHPDFLAYCGALLDRYRHDSRVWCISGTNHQHGQWRGDGSYYFSRYNHCWGWASWRRCWQHYDGDLARWPTLRQSGLLQSVFDDPMEARWWGAIWDRLLHEGRPDSWAYRWTFSCMSQGGLTALPNRNLVANIGFDDRASNTRSQRPTMVAEPMGTLRHPTFVLRDRAADRHTYLHHFGGRSLQDLSWVLPRLTGRLRRLVGR